MLSSNFPSALFSIFLVCFFATYRVVYTSENNVCPTFDDYYTIKNNSHCWYDFAAEYDVLDIIRLNGYQPVEYKIQTADGYILRIFRILGRNNPYNQKYPVYMQHGLVATCANFIALGKNSIAFLLADLGHDVWLGNFRGNFYGEGHTHLSVYDKEFWDHSMDEIVAYDFPAIFQTIQTNSPPESKMIFIGHSLGTTLFLMYAAEFPNEAERIFKFSVLLSPAYTLGNMISPFKTLAPYGPSIMDVVDKYNMIRIVSQAEPLRRLVWQVCLEAPTLMRACMQQYNLFYGKNTDMGPETIPVYFNQLPGGTSLKILNHAADLVLGHFRKYNYGPGNMKHYGQFTPPIYDIKKILVPTYIVYSIQDWATTELDAWNLFYSLSKKARYDIRRINKKRFNHMDFVFGRHARQVAYDKLLEVIENVVSNNKTLKTMA